jgi:alkylation response protein AidB-like acyl-CoA dehydrogenase
VAVGVAQDALDATVAYTTERIVFGKPVAHHQANAFDLAALATRVHGARLAVRDAASSFDAAGGTDPDAGFWATQAWLEATEAAVAVTEAGIQLLGGHGFLVDHLAEKRFREARMLGLLAGGLDAALDDLAGAVLDVPDPLLGEVPV